MGSRGLEREEPAALAMMEEEQASTVEWKLEEGVEQVEKKVPPSSFS